MAEITRYPAADTAVNARFLGYDEDGITKNFPAASVFEPDAVQLGASTTGTIDASPAFDRLVAQPFNSLRTGMSGGSGPPNPAFLLKEQIFIPYQKSLEGEGLGSKFILPIDTTLSVVFACNTDGNGHWIVPFPGETGTTIDNLYLNFEAAAANGHYPIAFEFGGSHVFHEIHAGGVQTLIGQIDEYSDMTRAERIGVFHQPTSNGWLIDWKYTGDGRFTNQISSFRYFDDGADGAIDPSSGRAVRTKREKYVVGSVTMNTLNGWYLYDQCDSVFITSMHMEDGVLEFRDSSGSVQDAAFWMRSDAVGDLSQTPLLFSYNASTGSLRPGVIDASNIDFVYHQEFRGEGYSITKPNFMIVQTPNPYLGVLNVRNFYRGIQPNGLGTGIGTKVGANCGMPDFDNYSHIASVQSRYIQNRWVISGELGDLPATDDLIASVTATNEYRWGGPSGTYFYRLTFLLDRQRLIGINGAIERSVTVTNGGAAPVIILSGTARKNVVVKVERGTTTGVYNSIIYVPLLAGSRLGDTYTDIGGYAWGAKTPGAILAINSCLPLSMSIQPGETSAASDAYGNVHILQRSPIMPTVGAWRRGDVVEIASPANDGSSLLTGYRRLTSCTLAAPSNVLNVDWFAVWTPYRTPAFSQAELESITTPVNTINKTIGKAVYGVTAPNLKPLYASGSAASAPWVDVNNAVVYTPV